ncbi:MAG: enoyl-CoA hydratase/isomerase family protein [Desulfobacteraceae bacterium]|nr:MAG: enoyl-CoA hydratase/isomerase family protein [Desulfobacteraceae bacterium]
MLQFIRVEKEERVGIIFLNRPQKLNAWHKPMRDELLEALRNFESSPEVSAVILTGAGGKAFCAGQDLGEAKTFDPDRAEEWIEEWRTLYGFIRSLSKPLVVALNGLAAGSGFQVALLGDVRIGHPEVKMGQPEINSGIVSVTGPWIMREMLGLSRTIELILSGRMMEADECAQTGLIHRLVPREALMPEALKVAKDLASKPPIAMRLTKQRMKEMTETSFQETMDAAVRIHRESYGTSEPQSTMEEFLRERAARSHRQ